MMPKCSILINYIYCLLESPNLSLQKTITKIEKLLAQDLIMKTQSCNLMIV